MGKTFLILLAFSLTSTGSSAYAYELPAKLQKMVGQTFSKPGPNCFAAALYGSGVYSSFRGISENEFSEVLKTSCEKIEEPKLGDIGVYQSKGFGFVHAFVYLDENSAFEKPGVDYVGKTPVRIQTQDSIDYVHIASQECRRWGDETCHNQKSYYRCGPVTFDKKFELTLSAANEFFDLVLIKGDRSLAVQSEIHKAVRALEALAKSDLEKAVFESIEKQLYFLGFETQKLLIF